MTIKITGTNTAAAPGITGTDTDTGLVYGTDTVSISTGGTARTTVNSSGHLLPGAADTYDLGANTTPWRNIWMENDLYIEDNGKAVFGTGEDLKIYHDGTKNLIESHNGEIHINKDTSEYMAKFIPDGAIELYYDNSKKFFTYSEGVRVDGYIKSHPDVSDSHWGENTHNWNMLGNNVNSSSVLICEHSGDTAPYGIEAVFTDNTPDNNSNWFYYAADLSAARFRVYSDGDVWTSDSGTLSSDETLKENIVDASPKLEDLKKLKVRNFNWKSSFHPEKSKKKQLGFIAQEVEEVFPALITEHDIAPTGSDKSNHTPVMKKAIKQAWDPIIIKAMQELIAKVETLETKVAALEAG